MTFRAWPVRTRNGVARDLRRNEITDVQPLASLTNLQSLSLWGNEIADVQPLASLTNLRKLSLWGNEIADVQPLASLTNLQWLQLGDNEIADVSPLASLTNLYWLGVVDNALSEHAVNEQLSDLMEGGIRVQTEAETGMAASLFADANLEHEVRVAVGRLQGTLYPADLASLTVLRANNRNIRSLAGLQHATALAVSGKRDYECAAAGQPDQPAKAVPVRQRDYRCKSVGQQRSVSVPTRLQMFRWLA